MKQVLILIYLLEIFLCTVLSISYLKKGTIFEKLLFPFFLLLFIIECYCYHLYDNDISRDIIYNLWFPVEFLFYGLFVASFINLPKTKKLGISFILVYLSFVIIYYSISHNISNFSSKSFMTGVVVILFILLSKLYEILNQEIILNPLKNPLFWFIVGLLVVNIGNFFLLGATNYLIIKNKPLLIALGFMDVILTDIQYFSFLLYFYCKWMYQK
jgi:hypothetical protein